MRLIDADELMEHAMREQLDSRELIAKMIDNAPTECSGMITIEMIRKLAIKEINKTVGNPYGYSNGESSKALMLATLAEVYGIVNLVKKIEDDLCRIAVVESDSRRQ